MEFSEYYVAYFDVLGYKEAFKKSDDVSAKLVKSIEDSINLMKQIVSAVNAPYDDSIDEKPEIEYRFFSDNILVCYKEAKHPYSAFFLASYLRLIATIQRIFFEGFQLIVRGGVTKGPLYLTRDFVGGKALIDAVELEENAVYPRIVVDDCILNELNPEMQIDFLKNIMIAFSQDLLVKHIDDKFFLNYIISYAPWIWFPKNTSHPEKIDSFEEFLKNYREGCLRKPVYDSKYLKEVLVILKKHKEFVEKNINIFSQSSNDATKEPERVKILKKYLWLVSFHNKICDHALYKIPELKISLNSKFNEQTLAFDVSVG